MVWSGFRLACLPLPFICLPLLFICLPGCLWSGLRLACLPRAFICLPLPFICLPILFICLSGHFLSFVSHFFSLSPRLGACGRVPGRLVSHFLSFVSHFFSFVSQAGCLWSGSRLACLPLPFICLPGSVGWVLVVGFTSFQLSPRLGACGRVPGQLVSHFLSFVSHFFSACGRVPGRLVSHFLLFVSHFFSFVTHFFSFVSQAGCLWSGSRPACLPLAFICLPVLFIYLPETLHLSPRSVMPCSISIHLSLSPLISALFRWPCSISIHLSPRLVTGGVRPFPLFLFICLPGLSL